MTFETDLGTLGVDYICRAVELVRARRLPIVLVQSGVYYLADNPADLWGSKRYISHRDLRGLIDALDNASQVKTDAPQALPKIGPSSAGVPPRAQKQSA